MNALRFPEHVFTRDISYEAGVPPNSSFKEGEYGPNAAVIDNVLVESLERITNGKVTSWYDIELAEIAVRALILHEMVYWIHPSVLVIEPVPVHGGEGRIIAPESGRIVGPDFTKDYQVSENFRKNGIHVYQAWISGVYVKDGVVQVGSDFWKVNGEIFKAQDESLLRETFNEQLKIPYYKNKFLLSAKAIGAGSYLGNRADRDYEAALTRDISTRVPHKILARLDDSWAKEVAGGNIGLNIRLGPFLSIVLSRAENRHQIMEKLFDIRDDFVDSRKGLWELFGSILSEKRMAVALRDTRKLDSAIKSIVPAAFPRKSNPFGLLWGCVHAIKDIVDSGGVFAGIKFIGDVLLARDVEWAQVSAVQATKDLTLALKEIDDSLPKLLTKHLTEAELSRLGL